MSRGKPKYSFKSTAHQVIAAALAVGINVLLFLTVDALFAVDLAVSSGGVLS